MNKKTKQKKEVFTKEVFLNALKKTTAPIKKERKKKKDEQKEEN